MDLDGSDPCLATEREQLHGIADSDTAAPGRAGHHSAGPCYREHTIDRQPKQVVGDARLEGAAQRERREPQVDSDAPPLFLLPAVGIDAGERLHQGRLAVVDVTGGPDYKAAEGIGVRVAGGGTHARRSQKSRAESEPASAR